MSSTELFKEHVQEIVYQELGVKVSKDKAWKLFKALTHGIVEHVCNIEGNRISLAGIGSFEVLKSAPRGKKAGLDEEGNPIPGAKVWPFVPRFRFYTSSVIDDEVNTFFGLGDNQVEFKGYGLYAKDTPAAVEQAVEEAIEEEAAPAEAPVDDFFNL